MNEQLFYSDDLDEAQLFDENGNFVCENPSPEILIRFINGAIKNKVTRCSFRYTKYLTCILGALGYTVKIRPMTYHRIFNDTFCDRNFDVLDVVYPNNKEG